MTGSKSERANRIWLRAFSVAAVLAPVLWAASPALASNHFVRIEQLMAGANGDSRLQYVELKMQNTAQALFGPQGAETDSRVLLTFHDATGAETGSYEFPSDAPTAGPADPEMGNGGLSVLITTQAFLDEYSLAAGFADFILPEGTGLVGADGMVCFRDNTANANADAINACVSYGNYQGAVEEDTCLNSVGAAAGLLPIAEATPQALNRFLNFGPTEDFLCSMLGNAAFQLEAPTPRNNAGQSVVIPTLTSAEQGEKLFRMETFDGNGRSCVSCHTDVDDFGLTPTTIANLFAADPTDPLFVHEQPGASFPNLENTCLMRQGNLRGLILENIDGFASAPSFRTSPHLLNVVGTAPFGLSGLVGGANTLEMFCAGAILQHFPKTSARNNDPSMGPLDVRMPTAFELQAMEAFQETIVFPSDRGTNPPDIDAMIAQVVAAGGDATAIQNGRDHFNGSARCVKCHSGDFLADSDGSIVGTTAGLNEDFDIGTAGVPANDDDGCVGGSGDPTQALPSEAGRLFNTPTLIGVARTAPFFHDGSAPTLRDAVEHYDTSLFANSAAGQLVSISLTQEQIDDITAFLEAVSLVPEPGPTTLHGSALLTIGMLAFVRRRRLLRRAEVLS